VAQSKRLPKNGEGGLEQRSTRWMGGVVLKNKLRNLKTTIKQWSKDNGDISAMKIQNLRQKLNDMENIASDRILIEDEVMAKKSIQQDLWDASNAYESMLR